MVIGFFYGIFTVDVVYSLKLMTKIREFAKENKIIVHLEKLQQQIRKTNDEHKEKIHFWLSTKSETTGLKEAVYNFKQKIENEVKEKIKR